MPINNNLYEISRKPDLDTQLSQLEQRKAQQRVLSNDLLTIENTLNAGAGAVSGFAGLGGDMVDIMSMLQAMKQGYIPEHKPNAFSTDGIGAAMGADVDSAAFITGSIVTPDIADMVRFGMKGLLSAGGIYGINKLLGLNQSSSVDEIGGALMQAGAPGAGVSMSAFPMDEASRMARAKAPDWFNEPTNNAFAKGMTQGEERLDWLARHGVEKEGDKYVMYHATPKTSVDAINESGGIRKGSYLATDKETALAQGADSAFGGRGLKADDMHLEKVLIDPWEFDTGFWPTLKVDKPLSLPMDEASRMGRAKEMGFDTDLYHGTHADIDEFDPDMGDIGTHFGSREQAENRLKDVAADRGGFDSISARSINRFELGANVMPVKANLGKQLEMPDVGMWNDSDKVISSLEDMPEFRGRLDDAWNDLGVKDSYEDTADWIASPENREMLDEINTMLRDDGYDTVKYKNAVENKYGGNTPLRPEIKAAKDKVSSEIKAVSDGVFARRPELRGNESAEEIQEWLKWDFDAEIKPHEAKRIKDLEAKSFDLGNSDAHYEDPYSYIVLDPAKVRSRNAKFDPSKKDSANLMAGAAGGGLTASLIAKQAQQEQKQTTEF